jgi:hypothetical protein
MCFGHVKRKELLGLPADKARYNRDLRTGESTCAASEISVTMKNTLVWASLKGLSCEIADRSTPKERICLRYQ